jgi:hypothetical protein
VDAEQDDSDNPAVSVSSLASIASRSLSPAWQKMFASNPDAALREIATFLAAYDSGPPELVRAILAFRAEPSRPDVALSASVKGKPCTGCGGPRDLGEQNPRCRLCRNEYQRGWQKDSREQARRGVALLRKSGLA